MRIGALMTGAAALAACVVALLVTPAARAGTIWVTDGNMNAGQTGDCAAFDFYPGPADFETIPGCPISLGAIGEVPAGANSFWMTTAPPGITINGAWTANPDVASSGISDGFVVGDFWENSSGVYGGSTLAYGQTWFNTSLEGSANINSQIYGIQLVCTHSASQGPCVGTPYATVGGVELDGTENTGPAISGGDALWTEPNGAWVWNPAGESWAVAEQASDVSGVCDLLADVGGIDLQGPTEPRDSTVWQQCPTPASWDFDIDTRSYVPTSGDLQAQLIAVNAAGVGSSISKVVQIDNDPVTVSVTTPNDPNPSVWVNHAVTVDATATAGPSGVGGMNCSEDGASATSYPASGLTVNGNGVHTVSCTAWNNAVDPQGQPNTGTSSLTIHIDEAPPSLAFEPQSPSDPTALTVDTGDNESGVAGGSIQMAPAGTSNWTTLPTTFDGSHLLTSFDDAGLSGPYNFQATSCDNVGNCATTSERLTLPLRAASDSEVSLTRIVVKCTTRRVRSKGRWRVVRNCKNAQPHPTNTLAVPYGQPVTVHGLYTTSAGVPLGGQPVQIFAAPNNGLSPFSQVAVVTTAADGSWTATLPAGPSRIVRAVTNGSATILPSSGQVTTIVPARIRLLKVWPRHVAWGGTVHLVGQLLGGYLPPGGALVRLRIGYGSTYNTYGVEEHVMGDGRFSTVASFGPGDPNVHRTYWFQIASLPMGNYPYAPAASQRVSVHVGGHRRAR